MSKLNHQNIIETDSGQDLPRGMGDNGSLTIEYVAAASLKADERSARRYNRADRRAAQSIVKSMHVRLPLLVGPDNVILWGEHIHAAALAEGIDELPIVRVANKGPAARRALSVAYTRLGELGSWEREQLGTLMLEFEAEIPNFDLGDLGFEVTEIDLAIEAAGAQEEVPEGPLPEGPAVSMVGDMWYLAKHRLLVGDATDPAIHEKLMGGASVHAVFTDPPFGCKIDGFVAGTGRHREFVMASGEMSEKELFCFFKAFLVAMKGHLVGGAAIYLVIDWRSLHLLLEAASPIYGKLINLAVWVKDRAGMGSFLRSQHELILIFKMPGKMRNNVELGKNGRHRSNIWCYPSAKTASTGSDEGNMLASHPTPKSVRMLADAILDTTRRGDIVLDPFLGSGTTLIAAEKVGRTCYGLELDPLYADLIVRRWQAWTGERAIHAETGLSFDEMADLRNPD